MDYEQLGHILESIHPGVTIADSSGVFRFVSNSYLSGRSVKGSDIIGKFAGSEEVEKAILLPLYTAKKERFTPMTARLSGKKS